MQQPLILLADDDLDDQELLEEAFLVVNPNVAVHAVSSGADLLQYLKECDSSNLPSLMVLDYNMPGMNGIEVLEHLSIRGCTIPAVVWSTSNSALLQKQSEEKGAREFYQKPMAFDDFVLLAGKMLTFCDPTVVPGD